MKATAACSHAARGLRLAGAVLAGASMLGGFPLPGLAAAPAHHASLGVKGRWTLVSKRSDLGVFPTVEPDERLDVTVDDGVRLAFQIRLNLDGDVEEESGDVRLDGRDGWGKAADMTFPGRVVRVSRNSAEMLFSFKNGARNQVTVRRVDPDVLIVEEKLTAPQGGDGSQRLIFVRAQGQG